jgi:hypothetical protein
MCHRTARPLLTAVALLLLWGADPAPAAAQPPPVATAAGSAGSPSTLHAYRGWHGMPTRRFRVTEPIFAQRIAELEQRSAFARARLEAIRQSGMRVWVATPEALRVLDPRAQRLPIAWVALLPGGRDVVAVIDVEWLRRQHAADGEFSEAAFLHDLDMILAHELFVHIGSIGPGRDLGRVCTDPDPVPGALGCSVVQENLFAHSLDPALPFRQEYRSLHLHTDARGPETEPAVQASSGYFPELFEDGWERSSYVHFAEKHALDGDTPFQRMARMLWENGERDRVEAGFAPLMTAIVSGRTQAEAEAALMPVLVEVRVPSAADRFRMRELAFVRAGKHERARNMARRRLELIALRPGVTLDGASAVVVDEMQPHTLEPETFEEAVELLLRHGQEPVVRQAFTRYLEALAAGETEAAVRERAFRELLPLVAGRDWPGKPDGTAAQER